MNKAFPNLVILAFTDSGHLAQLNKLYKFQKFIALTQNAYQKIILHI